MKENILFIGGAGFIGSNIIKGLVNNKNYQIFVMEPAYADISRLQNIPIKVFRGTISDMDNLASILKTNNISKVVHLVSTMVPGCGYDEYKLEFENVIFPTVRLMQYCSRNGILFIYFSSGGTVYGERKTLVPFVETDPMKPISYYGLSKQMIEDCIQFEHRISGLQYIILRPSNPYGPGQKSDGRQGLIAVALDKALAGKPITVWGDGSAIRDYIYIDDLVYAFCQLLGKKIVNETLNIGSGEGISVNQILRIVSDVIGEDVEVEHTPSRKSDVSNMILDNTKLKSIVDINFTPIVQGVRNSLKPLRR